MYLPDRTIQPEFREIAGINVPAARRDILHNGAVLYSHKAGTEDILRLEVVFPAGVMQQLHPLLANTCLQMLLEGSRKRTGYDLAQALEYYGAWLNLNVDNDFATLSLHCLSAYFEDLLPILAEIISEPAFPEERLNVFLRKQKQQFEVNMLKVDFLARRRFLMELFGECHPIGRQPGSADYDTLNVSLLHAFHRNHFLSGSCGLFLSGNVSTETITMVDRYLGFLSPAANVAGILHELPEVKKEIVIEHKDEAVQSGIRLGCLSLSRQHPDFQKLMIANTVLGGYFGSRLMQSVREDLGYTYGIGSFVVPSLHHAYFVIGTETGTDVTLPALEAIEAEIEKLKSSPPEEDELGQVKNYLLGKLLKGTDGAFAQADRQKTIILHQLPDDYYEHAESIIRSITGKDIAATVQKYFEFKDFVKVVAGDKFVLNKITP